MAQHKLLITEAFEDENFFKSFLRDIGINDVVVRSNPTGKGNAIRTFCDTLESKTVASSDRIGLIVDADHAVHGAGYKQTVIEINQRLALLSFNPLADLVGGGKTVVSHRKSKLRVGVWIMPNNSVDGAMEDFLLTSVAPTESSRYRYAQTECSKALAQNLGFPTQQHHISKANFGTWTAWQDPPRSSFAKALQNQLFDTSSTQFKALTSWLHWLYA